HIVADPNIPARIYVGAMELSGYKTDDFGKTWKQLFIFNQIEPEYQHVLDIHPIVIDPSNSNIVYAGVAETFHNGFPSQDGSLYKSTDGGHSWKPANKGLPEFENASRIWGLAINHKNPSVLYIGPFTHGIYKSTDGGENWSYAGLSGQMIRKIAIDPINPEIVYAGGRWYSKGLFKSKDGGKNWELLFEEWVWDIAINPKNSDIIYIASLQMADHYPKEGDGLYKSIDGGKTWQRIPDEVNRRVTAVVLDYRNPDVIYAEVLGSADRVEIYRSKDGGSNWELLAYGSEFSHQLFKRGSLVVDPHNPNTIYIASYGAGAYKLEENPVVIESNTPSPSISSVAITSIWPNPFSGLIIIQYQSPFSPVLFKVYDIKGRVVRTLLGGIKGSG
ncbi:MAG: hypothetical protein AB1478_12385, partial [Nitrospirota bacterium]